MEKNPTKDSRGKSPGIRRGDGLWSGVDWLKLTTTETDLDLWHSWQASVGIRLGAGLVAVDVDTLVPELAEQVRTAAMQMLGASPMRIGQAPKFLLLYRCTEDRPYQRATFDGGIVELLTEGKQFVAHGIHPKTGQPYRWEPHVYFKETLAPVTGWQIDAFFARLAEILPAAQISTEASATRADVDQAQLAGNPDTVAVAIAALPNDHNFTTRDSYIRVGAAIKAALPRDDRRGLELFQDWASRWTGGTNDPDGVADDWKRLKPPFSVGAQYLYGLASEHGSFSTADAWFTAAGPSIPTQADAASGEEWPEPLDVFGDGDPSALMEIPCGALPSVLDRYARDVAARMGVPVAFAAAGTVAVASAAIGGALRIRPKARDTAWTEPAFMWFLLVERPGGRKTPLMAAVASPLAKLDAGRAKEDIPKRQAWEQASRKRGKDTPPLAARPKVRRSVVDSFTTEALRDVLADNSRGVLVAADEITGLIGGLDQYKANGGSDRADLLKLMDGRPRVFDRVSRSVRVDCWGASVLGGVQPAKLAELASSLDPDGLLQRFIPVVGDGERRLDADREPDHEAVREYEAVLTEIAEMPDPGFWHDGLVKLSDDAQAVRQRFDQRVQTLLDMPNVSEAWRGHLSKWSGIFARLLLVFHTLDNWRAKGAAAVEMPVSVETAEKAERFASFLLAHAIRFYEDIVGLGTAGDAARRAAGIILVEGKTTVTRRALYERHRPWRPNERAYRDLFDAMAALGRMGWCRAAAERESWIVNPNIFVKFKERAAAEEERRKREYERVQAAVAEHRALRAGGRP